MDASPARAATGSASCRGSRRASGAAPAPSACCPSGSLEQHGEHLPVGTDSLLVETVCLRAAALARADVVVAPTVWTGLSPHHVRLGVTVTLEPELLLELTRQIVRCLRPWFGEVVIVNGHGGNRGWLGALALAEECPVVNYWELVEPAPAARALPGRPRLDRPCRPGRDVGDAGGRAGARRRRRRPRVRADRARERPVPRCPTWARAACSAIPARRLGRRRASSSSTRLPRRSPSCSTPSHDPRRPRRAAMTELSRRRRPPPARAAARPADGRVHPPAVERARLRAAARGRGARARARRHARRPLRRRRRRDHPPADRAAARPRRRGDRRRRRPGSSST